MKRIPLTLLALAMGLSPAPVFAASVAGKIISLQGQGDARATPHAEWKPAAIQQRLGEGDFVRTRDASRMAILLSDQTQIRLAANSMMQVKQIGDEQDRGTILKQHAGRSWAQSKNVPNKLTVETPTAIAAIRGTDWEISVADDGAATLTVLSGEVQFSNAQGAVSVRVGEQALAREGMAPVKRVLQNPRSRVQWVSSFTADPRRYPELVAASDPALTALARLLERGHLAEARAHCASLLQRPDIPAAVHLLWADFMVQEGAFEQALALLREGAQQYPDDARFDAWRARLHLAQDEVAEARAALASAAPRKLHQAEVSLVRAELARFEGDAAATLSAYDAALRQQPDSARAWLGLGSAQSEREATAPARQALQQAAHLDPDLPGLGGEIGTLETFADNLARARAAFNEAIRKQPDDYIALTGLGLTELKAGAPRAALDALLAATLIEPRYARAQLYLAVAYYQQDRAKDALFALSRARELDPRDPMPDMLESLIRNDRMQPGEALAAARRALDLLPYLKSLNQLANDQKGSANLGSALAAFRLEDWSRNYAQNSYSPFWAGSHLFLADRYSGDFNKKSEQFQGYLSDPTVFGASNRNSSLFTRPGHYASLGYTGFSNRDVSPSAFNLTANGMATASRPVAYFAEYLRNDLRSGNVAFSGAADTYTVALGGKPTDALGLFLYANSFDTAMRIGPMNDFDLRMNGRTTRFDLGAHYRFAPDSQLWLKLGQGDERASSDTSVGNGDATAPQVNLTTFSIEPRQQDAQLRHTFAANRQHEISWGLELGQIDDRSVFGQEQYFHPAGSTAATDRVIRNDSDRSTDLWLSDRFQVTPALLLQGDLAYQHYRKNRDSTAIVDLVPPLQANQQETFGQSRLAPRLGTQYSVAPGATLRTAYQDWVRPASFNSLAPVATAGIPLDDRMTVPGGRLQRWRGQLDWELSPRRFLTAFADAQQVDNLYSPLAGAVLNTRVDLTTLDRLRQNPVPNLAAMDHLEGTPVFSSGRIRNQGFSLNALLTGTLSGYAGYEHTLSENSGPQYAGKMLPYLPQHRATAGLTWTSNQRLMLGMQAAWRSQRYSDEANLSPLSPGWDMTLQLYWESTDKRWRVSAHALNLLNPDNGNSVGAALKYSF